MDTRDTIHTLLVTLARSENAMTLQEFIKATELSTTEVSSALDTLVQVGILRTENSYFQSDIGDMTYMFGDTEDAQAAFEIVKPTNDINVINEVRKAATKYWSTINEIVTIESVMIAERQETGDIIVRVSWSSESTKDQLRDDMMYTVSENDDHTLFIDGPEW